jgi:hypothetical protein
MRLTGDGIWGEPRDPEECKRVLRTAVELDVTLIDTAAPARMSSRNASAKGWPSSPGSQLATGKLARPGGALDQIAERHDATPAQIGLSADEVRDLEEEAAHEA